MNEKLMINDLNTINLLDEKATILLNQCIDNDFYDYYFEKPIEWLLSNKEKIEKDYQDNLDKLKFHIIFSKVDLHEKDELILHLREESIEEFSNYVSIFPYSCCKAKDKLKIEKMFEKFKNQSDDYLALQYFEKIKR